MSQLADDPLGDCQTSAGATRASMFRFRADRVLWSASLDDRGRLCCSSKRDESARVIQAAYRRFLAAGEPVLAMPPQLWHLP